MKSAIHSNKALLILLVSLAVFSAWGEPTTLEFEECIALASRHNADLRNAQANLLAAEHRARAAYAGYLPQLSGNAGYSDSSGSVATTGTVYSTGLTATQNLFAGFQDQAKVAQAAANLEAAHATLLLAKAQLSRDLKTAYAGLLYAQDSVTLTENILRRLEENLRLVQLRFESGRENKGSYLLTRASVAQGRFDYLQARQALTSAQAQLTRVIGQGISEPHAVRAAPVTEPPLAPDFGALARAAPEVREAAAKERAAEAEVQLARAGFHPSVNLSGSVAREGENWTPNGDRRSVSASVSIPLFSGGKDLYGVRGAAAALDAAKAGRESVERQQLVRLNQNYAAYVESVERLKVDREFLDAAETRANISRARYQNGLMTFEDWDRIESDLIQRQKTLLAAQRDRVNAEAAWELAQGKGVIP